MFVFLPMSFPVDPLSAAMKWRENLIVAFKDYCENTTLHGYKYLVLPGRKIYERLMWLTVVVAAVFATIVLFKVLLTDYWSTPTVTTQDSSKYPIRNVPFPGIAICNINKISKKNAMNLAVELQQLTNYSSDVIFDSVRFFGRLYDYEVEDIEKTNLLMTILDQSNILKDTPERLLEILEALAPQCSDMLVSCRWQGRDVNCSKIFSQRRTVYGFCCTFNYVKTLPNIEELNTNKTQIKNGTIPTPSTIPKKKKLRTPNAGLEMGLTVVLQSNIEDYYYPLLSSEGLSAKIFNSYDYPDASSGGLSECFLPIANEVFLQVTATTVQAVEELRGTSIDSRDCLFENEGTTVFDKTYYSYSDCLAECKMKSILAICECVPFFMPITRGNQFGKQICTLLDISCLNKYKDKWLNIFPDVDQEELEYERQNSVHCPSCWPTCSYVSYSISADYTTLIETKIPGDLMHGLDPSEHTVLHVYFASEFTTLYKTDLFYYWFDIISNFGGICSLFLGFSLISVAEFAYFFTVRYLRQFETKHAKQFIH